MLTLPIASLANWPTDQRVNWTIPLPTCHRASMPPCQLTRMNGGSYKKPMPLAARPWSIAVMLAGLLASGKPLAAADRAASPDNAEGRAHAAYPKPFSRPNSMGENYDTWRDAKGPDVGETTVDVRRLPSRVDNSTRPEFPPIY